MSQIVTLTNKFCKSLFRIERLLTAEEVKELANSKYVTADIKPIHWKMFFLEVAKINSFNIEDLFESHTYRKSELLKKLGIKKNYSLRELHYEIENISSIKFRFESENTIDTYSMLKKISTNFNENTITLTANDELKRFLLIGDVRGTEDGQGFTQFDVDILMNLKSVYTIRLYLYLSTFKNVSTTSLSIDNLYRLFNIHKDYASRDLVNHVVKKACKEISDKTELNIIPVAKKRVNGKETTSVSFTIQSKAVVQKELSMDLFIKSFMERQSLKLSAPEVKKQMEMHVNTIKTTLDSVYNNKISEHDIYKAIGYCGGDIKMAANLMAMSLKEKAGSNIGYVRAKTKKENITPLQMFK